MAISAGDIVIVQGNASDGWDMKIVPGEQGDILYFNGTNWTKLGHGTDGQYLKTKGHAANPEWGTIAGGGDVVGPASSTDAQIVLFDGITGKLIKAYTGTGVLRADSGVINTDSDVTDLVSAASDSASGKVELAIASEVTTGTDTTRAITPDSLAGSTIFGRKAIQITCFDYTANTTTGDGKGYFVVPEEMNGMNLVRVHARVITAGTTNTTDIQIANVTDSQDMLSTKITIDSTETGSDSAATAPVINATYDDVATNDLLRIDVDAISTTAAKGLIVTLEFQLP